MTLGSAQTHRLSLSACGRIGCHSRRPDRVFLVGGNDMTHDFRSCPRCLRVLLYMMETSTTGLCSDGIQALGIGDLSACGYCARPIPKPLLYCQACDENQDSSVTMVARKFPNAKIKRLHPPIIEFEVGEDRFRVTNSLVERVEGCMLYSDAKASAMKKTLGLS